MDLRTDSPFLSKENIPISSTPLKGNVKIEKNGEKAQRAAEEVFQSPETALSVDSKAHLIKSFNKDSQENFSPTDISVNGGADDDPSKIIIDGLTDEQCEKLFDRLTPEQMMKMDPIQRKKLDERLTEIDMQDAQCAEQENISEKTKEKTAQTREESVVTREKNVQLAEEAIDSSGQKMDLQGAKNVKQFLDNVKADMPKRYEQLVKTEIDLKEFNGLESDKIEAIKWCERLIEKEQVVLVPVEKGLTALTSEMLAKATPHEFRKWEKEAIIFSPKDNSVEVAPHTPSNVYPLGSTIAIVDSQGKAVGKIKIKKRKELSREEYLEFRRGLTSYFYMSRVLLLPTIQQKQLAQKEQAEKAEEQSRRHLKEQKSAAQNADQDTNAPKNRSPIGKENFEKSQNQKIPGDPYKKERLRAEKIEKKYKQRRKKEKEIQQDFIEYDIRQDEIKKDYKKQQDKKIDEDQQDKGTESK